ncbi:MAG: amidohydrolase [Dehalococcoidia bacterium]|nr:MAG: amidohydrolase [Dehalococcoidia bacterium]
MADLFLRNARIWTGDASSRWAEAALVRDGRFAAVSWMADVDSPSGVEVIDAGGRLVVPGFTDAHAHLLGVGAAKRNADLKGCATLDGAIRRVAERVASTPAGGWVRGAGWDQNDWPGARFPHRRDLDAVAPEHPVVLMHTSGHCYWVNSAALRAANVGRDTAAPVGGAIDVGDDGEPTGILFDAAARLVTEVVPPPTAPERLAALRDGVAHAHALGITCVHAMDAGRGELQALYALRDTGELRLRVRAYLSATRLDEWFDRNLATGDGDDMLRIGGVKFFTDGALGSLTAWMLEPYEGSTDTGLAMQPPEELEQRVRACLDRGLAPAVHAIGDRANRAALDMYERLRDVAPRLPRRIEHAQLLTADDLPRFAALGVVASVQPIHATQDMAKVDRSWGARGRRAYAFASLLASGATLACGSDAPVEDMNPIAGIHAAVTRRNAHGEPFDGWYPGERVSLEAALSAYTRGAAVAAGEADTTGCIAPGRPGDFVVLSHDLFEAADPMRILDACADVTVVGGEVVYRRDEN